MFAFLRAISPVMQQISGDDIDWLALFGERGDDLLSAIAIAGRQTPVGRRQKLTRRSCWRAR